MPHINITLYAGSTREKKEQVAKRITDVIREEMPGVPDQFIWVTFNDVPKSDWCIAGKMCDEK